MPRTVDEGFRDFLTKLTASESETSSAKSHRESIETRLEQDFGLYRLFRIGSFGNGTSISGHSDVDYLASLKDKFYGSSSNYSLSKVRDSLDARFPRTGVRVNCPAVCVPFGTSKSENHEIVPGDNAGKDGDFIVYRIPDCADGWMKVSPEAHIHYVNEVDKKLSSKREKEEEREAIRRLNPANAFANPHPASPKGRGEEARATHKESLSVQSTSKRG